MINAAADFTLTPASVSDSLDLGDSSAKIFTIENTGDEILNLTISKTNFQKGTSSIGITLNKTSVVNLGVDATISFKASYTASLGVETGVYAGLVVVTNQNDTSQKKNSSLGLTISSIPGALLEVSDVTDDTVVIIGDLDERKTKTFKLKNIGTIDLTNIQLDFTDLNGQSSSDEIDKSDLDIDDNGFDLDVGQYKRLEVEVDIPKNIDIDTYEGKIKVTTNEGYTFDIYLEVEVEGGDMKIYIDKSALGVSNGVMKLVGEPGDLINNYEFVIENDGTLDAQNLVFEVQYNLEELYSSETLSKDLITFSPSTIDIDSDDKETIEVSVDIPDDIKSGTYVGKVRVLSSTGKVYDSFRIEVKVIGDVYIYSVEFDEEVYPDSYLDVEVVLKNQGSDIERYVKVTGTIENIDYGYGDLIESTGTFTINPGMSKTQNLRFQIPKEASDGEHTLEIKVEYEDGTIVELNAVNVVRPDHNLNIVSAGVGQNSISCGDESLFVFAKVKNLGKYDEEVDFSAEITGTGIKSEINGVDIIVDDSMQKNFELKVADLESGTYNVVIKATYSGFFLKETHQITVKDCADSVIGADIRPIIDLNVTTNASVSDDMTTLFGHELEKTTVYLITAISAVVVLIVVSLFFI